MEMLTGTTSVRICESHSVKLPQTSYTNQEADKFFSHCSTHFQELMSRVRGCILLCRVAWLGTSWMLWPKLNSTVHNPERCSGSQLEQDCHSFYSTSVPGVSTSGPSQKPKVFCYRTGRKNQVSLRRRKAFKTFGLLWPVTPQGKRDTLNYFYLHSFVLHSLLMSLLESDKWQVIPESTFIKLHPTSEKKVFPAYS